MKYKLSLVAISLLAMSLNAGGVADCDTSNPTKKCEVNSLGQDQVITNQSVKVSAGTHKINSINVTGEKDTTSGAYKYEFDNSTNLSIGKADVSNMKFVNNSNLSIAEANINNSEVIHSSGGWVRTDIKNLNITNSNYYHMGNTTDYIRNLTAKNTTFTSKGGHIYFDSIVKADGLIIDIVESGGATIKNKAKDEAGIANRTQVNVGRKFNIESGNEVHDLDIINSDWVNINGAHSGASGLNVSGINIISSAGKIDIVNNVTMGSSIIDTKGDVNVNKSKLNTVTLDVKGGTTSVNSSTLTDTNINMTAGTTNIENATLNKGVITANGGDGQYVKLDGNVVMNGTEITRTNSSRHGSHNIIVNDNANVSLIDTKLSNLSINAYGINNKVNRLNIKGGSLTNTSIGTVVSNKRYLGMSHLVLDGVNVDNSAISATSPNIVSEYLDIKNVDGMAKNIKANIYVEKDLLIENATIDATSNINSGETIAKNSTVNGKVIADILHSNGSTFSGDITTGEIHSIGSTFKEDIITGDIFDSGSTFNLTVNAVSINSIGSTFSNTVDTLVLNASDKAQFQNVNINCIEAPDFKCSSVMNGSSVSGTLTLNNDAKLLLDKGSSVANLTLSSNKNYVAINGDSSVTGIINNEGVIEVFKGTVSNNITGTGDLITHGAIYTGDVNLSDIKGSGSTFNSAVKATDSMEVDNGVFKGIVTVGGTATSNATLYAYQGNEFQADVTADNAILSYNINKDISKGKKITFGTNLTAKNDLTIKDLEIKAIDLKASTANISNATITSTALKSDNTTITNSKIESKLVGQNDTADIYSNSALSGKYTIKGSEITRTDVTGGIRVNELDISDSQVKSQVVVNTLKATNNTFYVFGGGEKTNFYNNYSGAIIVKESAIGSGNTIQLSNTNLGELTRGYVPIAIINEKNFTPPPSGNPPITKAVDSSTGGGISKDFFRVAYKTKIAEYELAEQFLHFNKELAEQGKYVWSVGVAGDDFVDSTNFDAVINGTASGDAAMAIGSKAVGVDYKNIIVDIGNMFNFNGFDQIAVESAKFIIASPEYVARTKLNIPYNRYQMFKSNKIDNGFWMNNKNGYSSYANSSIHHTDFNVGMDKTTTLDDNSSLMLGLATNLSSSSTKGNVVSDATSRGFGMYAMRKFDSGMFVGFEGFYHNIDTTYKAESLGVSTDKKHNVYTASISFGKRIGNEMYVEPSLKYDMVTYKPSTITGDGISIEGDRQIIHTLGVNIEAGRSVADKLDAYVALGYAKELTDKQDLHIKDSVRPHTVKGEKGDGSIRTNLGLNYNLTPKMVINADFGYNKYSNQDKEYKTNMGFVYKF